MKKIIALFLSVVCSLAMAQTFPVNNLQVNGNVTGSGGSSPVTITTGATVSGGTLAATAGATVSSSFTATGLVTLADHATQAANTIIGNGTGSTASPTALLMPSCSTTASALNWTAATGFTCNSAVIASNVSGTVGIANGGTSAISAAGALLNLGADPINPTANKDLYVSPLGNDGNSGASWGYAKLTLQAAINVASTGGTVHVASGTYSLSSELFMQQNVTIQCVRGAVITQANGANLGVMIDWSTNVANGAGITGCVIDGNRANNTDNAGDIMLYPSTANDINISNNTIQNGNGDGIVVTTGVRPIISYNKMSNFYVGPIYIVTGVGQTATYAQVNNNTIYGNIGQHAITLNDSDYDIVSGNTVTGSLVTGMVVNQSSTTVTSVSGPNFSSLSPGSFIILNGGTEELITAIASNTSMTVNTSNTFTGVPAAAGPGDLISIGAASFSRIIGNSVSGGVGGGLVISNFIAGTPHESTQKVLASGNIIRGSGEGCIEIESVNTFSTQVFDTQLIGNQISNCGVGTTAVASNTLYGIALIDFNPNTLLNTFIDSNYVRDDQGSATTQNWLGITSVGVGQVFVGRNTQVGTVNIGIAGGISSVTLSAGWGSTATATSIFSFGNSFFLTVNSSGTGQAANAIVTVNTRATTSDNTPVMNCKYTGGTGTLNSVFAELPGVNSSPSVQLFQFSGVPVAGSTYTFLCRG